MRCQRVPGGDRRKHGGRLDAHAFPGHTSGCRGLKFRWVNAQNATADGAYRGLDWSRYGRPSPRRHITNHDVHLGASRELGPPTSDTRCHQRPVRPAAVKSQFECSPSYSRRDRSGHRSHYPPGAGVVRRRWCGLDLGATRPAGVAIPGITTRSPRRGLGGRTHVRAVRDEGAVRRPPPGPTLIRSGHKRLTRRRAPAPRLPARPTYAWRGRGVRRAREPGGLPGGCSVI
jgi:hypothetical protein